MYFVLFTNNFSRISWVYFVKYKFQTFECFKKFKVLVENQSSCTIKTLRIDQGDEFLSK